MVAAGSKLTVSDTGVPVLRPFGVKVAWTVQDSPEAKVVEVVEIVQPALEPAVRVMSVESVCATPLAAMLPALLMVPVRVVDVLVPKPTLVRLRGIDSKPVCVASAA